MTKIWLSKVSENSRVQNSSNSSSKFEFKNPDRLGGKNPASTRSTGESTGQSTPPDQVDWAVDLGVDLVT